MREERRPRGWITALKIILLALVCIGGAELITCRIMDPLLFARICAPVRQGVETAAVQMDNWKEALWPQELSPEEIPLGSYAGASVDWPAAADPSITSLETQDGLEILTGGAWPIVYFNQVDPAWAEARYGTDTIGQYGCGPAAMAMAVSSLTGETVNPSQMADWAVAEDYWAKGHGSYLSLIEGAGAAFGLSVESCPNADWTRIQQELLSGKILVALVKPGHFTQSGHFILLRGCTLEGSVLVADPSSRERSLTLWDPQVVLDELSASRGSGAPLWIIGPGEGTLP